MVTTVGTSNDIATLIEDFIYLERDAIAAYEATIERLEDEESKRMLETFKADHHRHLAELKQAAAAHGANAPEEGDMKQMLTTGKVKMAGMMGDGSLLKAMSTNETDTVSAYENGAKNEAVPEEARPVFERALDDERRHKAWMEEASARL